MEPMNQMPPSPQMPPPAPPMGNNHVCGAGCWHLIVFGILIIVLAAGGVWWYMTQYQAPSALDIESSKEENKVSDEDAALEAELGASNFDNLDQESANLEAELGQ